MFTGTEAFSGFAVDDLEAAQHQPHTNRNDVTA
jgi:hypothetical protein